MLRHSLAILEYCFVLLLMLVLVGTSNLAISGESSKVVFKTSELVIVHDENRHHFNIEIANTPRTRQRGLMERKRMDLNAGMLFDFDRPQFIRMWMKNTFIPLDMIFIDKTGFITGIASNTTPHSTKVIASPGLATAVLELTAGTASRLKINVGDRVIHDIFQP